jgi:hypothetical protein
MTQRIVEVRYVVLKVKGTRWARDCRRIEDYCIGLRGVQITAGSYQKGY